MLDKPIVLVSPDTLLKANITLEKDKISEEKSHGPIEEEKVEAVKG